MKTRIVEVSDGFVPQVDTGNYASTWNFGSTWVPRWEGVDSALFLWLAPSKQRRWATCSTVEDAEKILKRYIKRKADENKLRKS